MTNREVIAELKSIWRSYLDSYRESDGVIRNGEAKRAIQAIALAIDAVKKTKRKKS